LYISVLNPFHSPHDFINHIFCAPGSRQGSSTGGSGTPAETTDSDSGVFIHHKNFNLDHDEEEEESGQDYLTMVQEALVALDKGSKNGGGVSQISVLLYVINRFNPKEEVRGLNKFKYLK